jgi:hypothetical protein
MKVVLNTFACGGIEAFLGRDIAAGVQTALRHYTRSRRSSDRKAPEFPRFLSESSVGRSGADLELVVEPDVQAALEREARESDGVTVEQIATHAVLVYLADLDRASGRETRPLTWA